MKERLNNKTLKITKNPYSMKKLIIALILLVAVLPLQAQKLITRNGTVKFFSAAPIENINAVNKQVSSVIDLESGEFAFLVPIKAFVFEKALMQEHFNENYMESGQFPSGSFKGNISDFDVSLLEADGEYPLTFSGVMTIHGTDKELTEKATLKVKNGKISLHTEFDLRPEDFGIKIPSSKRDNISEVIAVSAEIDYEKK